MKNYKVEHLKKKENIDEKTECLCQKVSEENRKTRIHNHDFYEIFLTLTNLQHFINGKTEHLERGTLVFVKPKDIHGIIYNEETKCEIINLSFSPRILKLMCEFASVSQTFLDNLASVKVMLNEYETRKLSEKLEKAISINSADIIYIRQTLFELFTMFLIKTTSMRKIYPEWFENMCSLMKEKENFVIGVERMTEISKKSREYVSRSVKKYLGITATEFVNDLRLNYAASKIINTDENITDIGLECGFYSISWFNKMFIKKYGMSPNKFRKRERNYESIDI